MIGALARDRATGQRDYGFVEERLEKARPREVLGSVGERNR